MELDGRAGHVAGRLLLGTLVEAWWCGDFNSKKDQKCACNMLPGKRGCNTRVLAFRKFPYDPNQSLACHYYHTAPHYSVLRRSPRIVVQILDDVPTWESNPELPTRVPRT